jgi:cysteine-rich repeat protein
MDIDSTNIPTGAAWNWDTLNPDEWSWTGSYDVNSVMHYYPDSGSTGGDIFLPKPGVVLPRGGITFPSHTDVHHCCEMYWEHCHNICGDGLFAPGYGEECDDGNNVDGDGCTSDCKKDTPDCVPTCNPHEWPAAGCGLRASCTPFSPFGFFPNSGNTYCMCQAGYRASGLPPNSPEQYRVNWDNGLGGQTHRVFVRPGQDCDQLCDATGANTCSEVPIKDSCR